MVLDLSTLGKDSRRGLYPIDDCPECGALRFIHVADGLPQALYLTCPCEQPEDIKAVTQNTPNPEGERNLLDVLMTRYHELVEFENNIVAFLSSLGIDPDDLAIDKDEDAPDDA